MWSNSPTTGYIQRRYISMSEKQLDPRSLQFTKAPAQHQPGLSAKEQIRKTWYAYWLEYHSAFKKKDILSPVTWRHYVQCEISRAQSLIVNDLTYMQGVKTSKNKQSTETVRRWFGERLLKGTLCFWGNIWELYCTARWPVSSPYLCSWTSLLTTSLKLSKRLNVVFVPSKKDKYMR